MTRQLTITTALLAFLSFSGQWHDSAAAFSPAWAPSNGTDNGGRTPACVIRNGSGQEAGAIPACATSGQRSVQLLAEWEFRRDHDMQAAEGWEKVTIPHDWAIYGPFDRANDLQEVAVVQNGEEIPTVKTGRSGGLPYMGKGCYRRLVEIPGEALADSCRYILLFDGAMSEARIFVNDREVCFWPYGYNSFHCDITDAVHPGENSMAVLLENRPQSSRWYPGAGLYRKVRLVKVPAVHIPVWGTYVTTPYVSSEYACVSIKTEVAGMKAGDTVTVRTVIEDVCGKEVASSTDTRPLAEGMPFEQQFIVTDPLLWSPESPALYTARTEILTGGSIKTDWTGRHKITVTDGTEVQDSISTRFGIRSIEIRPGKGFFLNGDMRKFKGVCLHHDLGPLGAAVNTSAIRHQLTMLKDMGCDAIRTSHNMPAEELVDLCDEMGFMLMAETFDEWDVAKCENGYHRFFDDWAEKDVVNLIRHFRNSPSIVMWSIGNEVPSQWTEGGYRTAMSLQDICHREDPTRPVTCGMDQFDAVLGNGFAARMDIAGFNYKPGRYTEARRLLPQGLVLGAETASTVSSRGTYHFPVTVGYDLLHPDNQSSSYDVEFCSWSNIPDDDFAADEDYGWVMGQFMWTGFDYLGEPSPYDTDAWPNHSSMFGAIDLASIPKDRFWLYRSIWNTAAPTLHILPHWTWPGREGERTPVFVYTSWPEAELFVNGVSYGRKSRITGDEAVREHGLYGLRSCGKGDGNAWKIMERFRLMWNDVVYEPGEIRVVAYDADGNAVAEKTVRTAGKARSLKIEADRWNSLPHDMAAAGEKEMFPDGVSYPSSGKPATKETVTSAPVPACRTGNTDVEMSGDPELIYLNVSVVDKDGNPVPTDSRSVKVDVKGAGRFRAVANGDPTCLEMFHRPQMHLFNGQLTVIIARDCISGSADASDRPSGNTTASGRTSGHKKPEGAAEGITVTVTARGLRPAAVTIP